MAQNQSLPPESLFYRAGLDEIQESVISSHFMSQFVGNADLQLYDKEQFRSKSLEIDAHALCHTLLPSMLRASNAFCADRAIAAKRRARGNYQCYGLESSGEVGLCHWITEVLFDRQYLRGPREHCSRELICHNVRRRIDAGAPIDMVIPALPFKISSSLKTRGRLPDLGEVNFILSLYEIVATVELVYREARPDLPGPLARFTIVSDGSRFNELVGEPASVIEEYRACLSRWIEKLGLEARIQLLDYCQLLRGTLNEVAWQAKAAIGLRARRDYADAMWPIFDPYNMAATIRAAAQVDPDPEYSNPEGRFVSLLKSLIYTINYKVFKEYQWLPEKQYQALYRDLTGHIFEPYTVVSPAELRRYEEESSGLTDWVPTRQVKECLRQAMLREAWSASIEYIAEIKSARDLDRDPIVDCLPSHLRWSIHSKPGQLAVLTASAFGIPVQAWAGVAVFKRTSKDKIKLCTLPVLALEGAGAIPVRLGGFDDGLAAADQPLFYIYPDIEVASLDDFLAKVGQSLVRIRSK